MSEAVQEKRPLLSITPLALTKAKALLPSKPATASPR